MKTSVASRKLAACSRSIVSFCGIETGGEVASSPSCAHAARRAEMAALGSGVTNGVSPPVSSSQSLRVLARRAAWRGQRSSSCRRPLWTAQRLAPTERLPPPRRPYTVLLLPQPRTRIRPRTCSIEKTPGTGLSYETGVTRLGKVFRWSHHPLTTPLSARPPCQATKLAPSCLDNGHPHSSCRHLGGGSGL